MNNHILIKAVSYFMTVIVTVKSEPTYPPIYYYEVLEIQKSKPVEITTDKYGNIFIKELIDESEENAEFDKEKFLEYVDTEMKGYSSETKARIRDRINREQDYLKSQIKPSNDRNGENYEKISKDQDPPEMWMVNEDEEEHIIKKEPNSKESTISEITPTIEQSSEPIQEDTKDDHEGGGNPDKKVESNGKLLIDDGKEVKDGQYAYHALIYTVDKDNHICSGAMLSERFIITAATCVFEKNKDNLKVTIGTRQNPIEFGISQIYLNDKIKVHKNNIALLKTKHKMEKIDHPDFRTVFVPVGTDVTITGFKCKSFRCGITKTTSNEVCSKAFPFAKEESLCGEVPNNEGGKKCFEELGSPVVWKNLIVGIVSHSKTGQPSKYMSIDYYYDWIFTIITRDIVSYIG